MRYRFISAEKANYPLNMLCRVMKVASSGYYAWLAAGKSKRQQENQGLIPLVREISRESDRTFGSRRMAEALRARGIPCGRVRAASLMRLAGVSVKRKKKFKVTTDSRHNLPVAPNLLNRDFEVAEPNRTWVSDITYVWTREGWLYLATVLDLFSRQVVGWAMDRRITQELVMEAFEMALWRRRPSSGLILHSDRGSQYCSGAFQQLLKESGAISSMSRKGDCWDNAVAESFFGTLKTERVSWRSYQTREEAKRDIVDYLEMFYNSKRLHSYLGYVSPRQFEEMWYLGKAA